MAVEVEWDEAKRLGNIEDHGVDFVDAALIFESAVLESEDTRVNYGERRFRALGRVDDDHFMVVYTWRGSRRRIISAWRIGENGKSRYQAILSRPA